MQDHKTFFFVRLVTITGDHLATETVWTDETDPAAIVPDAASFFSADENGAYDAETIAAGIVEVYGPFTLGSASLFRAVEDGDYDFKAEPFEGLDHAFLAVQHHGRRGGPPTVLATFKLADYPNADAAYAACDDVIADIPGRQLVEVGAPGEPYAKEA